VRAHRGRGDRARRARGADAPSAAARHDRRRRDRVCGAAGAGRCASVPPRRDTGVRAMSRLAARQSPLGTIAQTLPRLGRVLGNLRPTWHLDSLEALDDAFVARHAIRAILWDVDGTLTTFHGPEVAPPARRFLALCHHPGLRHAILSNAAEARYRDLGTIFPEIPVLKGFRVAGEVAMRELRHGRDSWPAERVAEVVAGGGVPLRKP